MKKEKMTTIEETRQVLVDYGGVIQKALPDYRVTVIVRNPKLQLSHKEAYVMATNDDVEKVVTCLELVVPENKNDRK